MTAPVWDERRAGAFVLRLAADLYESGDPGDRDRASQLCDAATVLPGGGTRERIERELHSLGWPGETVARAIEDLEASATGHAAARRSLAIAYQQKRIEEGRCMSDSDGDCSWSGCPQTIDGEPKRSGRSCPRWLATMSEDE